MPVNYNHDLEGAQVVRQSSSQQWVEEASVCVRCRANQASMVHVYHTLAEVHLRRDVIIF